MTDSYQLYALSEAVVRVHSIYFVVLHRVDVIARERIMAAMALQRCLLQSTRNIMVRAVTVKPHQRTYCEAKHKLSKAAANMKFTDRHEWIQVEKGVGTVGITDYAQEALGDVVFAQLPDPDTELAATDECGALESVKAASEIYSPASGVVTEKNKSVEDKPGLINSSCYEKGWLFKLKLTKPEELETLMTEAQYNEFLKTDADNKDH